MSTQTISSVSRVISLGSALAGGLIWVVAVAVLQPGWAPALFLFAPLVLVPLGLSLLTATDRHITYPKRWRAIVVAQLAAALLLLGAFALPVGPMAAALSLPWLLLTGLIALAGIAHSWPWKQRTLDEWCMYAGMVYVAIGGGWAVLSRAGVRPLGFSDIIVLATAVHFHYAGFVLPLLVGLAGRTVPGRMARLAAGGVILGVPMTAAGITLSAFEVRWPEWLAAWFLVAACAMAAALQWRAARRMTGTPRALLAISALALIGAMALAGIYALGGYWGTWRLEIPEMLPWHGAVNAFGFALMGLLGWNVEASEVRKPPAQTAGSLMISQGTDARRSPQNFSRRFWIMRNGT